MSAPAAAALVFVVSASVLVLEIVAARVVAPWVGASLRTWSALIGTVLAGMTLGSLVGGRAADRWRPERLLGALVFLGGLTTLAVPAGVAALAQAWAGRPGLSLVLALPLFLPAALLSAVTPVTLKLQLRSLQGAGRLAGGLGAASSAGAIFGTFLAGFVLVGTLPSTRILLGIGVGLAVGGAALGWRLWRRAASLAAGGGALVLGLALGRMPAPCELETAFNCARIYEDSPRQGVRALMLDTLVHGYVSVEDPTWLELPYARAVAGFVSARFPQPQPLRVLHLGGGAFTLPRHFAATRPGTVSRVLEVDAGLVTLARARLGLVTSPALEVEVVDARLGLRAEPAGAYDVVIGDAVAALSVPWHLATREMAAEVWRVLRPDGLYVLNVLDQPAADFARAELRTLADVFPEVALAASSLALDGSSPGNFVLAASRAPLPLPALGAQLPREVEGWRVMGGADVRAFYAGGTLLTDAFAPVDQLIQSPALLKRALGMRTARP